VEVVVDDPAPHEVRVAVAACGLCHSDLHYLTGDLVAPLPMVVGHEAAGVVEAVGSAVTRVAPGDRVVTCMSVFCGACPACARSETWLCANRERPPTQRSSDDPPRVSVDGRPVAQGLGIGGLADRLLVHEHAVAVLPDALAFDLGALLGCGVLTGAGTVFNAARVREGESVVVIGCGGVGLSAVNAAAIAGAARIVAVDRDPAALALAAALGATDTIVVDDGVDVVGAVRDLIGGGADHAIEAIGLSATMETAIGAIRPGGTASLVGIAHPRARLDLSALGTVWFNRRIQGVLMGANHFPDDIPKLADLALEGRLRLDLIATDRLPLDDVNAGFDRMRTGAAGRVVVVLGDT
jgi:S-(hydroxymethyl)glutathione dehydrogenase / alcohol dehydrogenase